MTKLKPKDYKSIVPRGSISAYLSERLINEFKQLNVELCSSAGYDIPMSYIIGGFLVYLTTGDVVDNMRIAEDYYKMYDAYLKKEGLVLFRQMIENEE